VILNIEGADPVAWPEQVSEWWEGGVRIIAMAYNRRNLYADGTGGTSGLTEKGRTLLRFMSEVGMILDLTHLAEPSFWEAINLYQGPMLASHNNCRSLVPGDRQFSDDQIRAIVAHGGVIGVAFDAWMLAPGYVRGVTPRETVSLENVVDHICHICDLAGNALHVAIGSDLDGGFGNEQTPCDLDTIADLQKIPDLLRRRGFGEDHVAQVMHGNWLRFLRTAWR
jgi:membrane dipeptidase